MKTSSTAPKPFLAALCLGAALVAAGAPPALADWLVTVNGDRIATRGPWEVKGRQVRFTAANGTFSALPVSEVDLDRSRELTAAAKAPPKAEAKEEKPKKEPVLVLTDKDIPRYKPTPGEGEANGAGESQGQAGTGEGEAVTAGSLRVSAWEVVDTEIRDGVTLRGSLINPTPNAAASIRLIVRVFDDQGEQVGQRYAELDRTALPPGEETTFTVNFPDVLSVSAVRFESRSASFQATTDPNSTT